jgi:hypothetical protein
MSRHFPQTDLASLVILPEKLRALAVLAALRFVTAGDLRGAGVTSETITALVDSELAFSFSLQRRMTDPEPTPVLALTRLGAREVAREASVDPETVASSTLKSCRRSAIFMDHSIALSGFAVRLAVELSDPGAAARLLSWEQRPDCLAKSAPVAAIDASGTGQPLIADGLALVDGPRGREALLVEIDRGTERPGYLGAKAIGYLRFWRDGGPERRLGAKGLRILVIAPDARRVERLMRAFREETGGTGAGLFWFASEGALTDSVSSAPVWSTLRRDGMPLW